MTSTVHKGLNVVKRPVNKAIHDLESPIPVISRSKRPAGVVPYYGGKALLFNWIVRYIPWSGIYVEPFGGGAAMLLNIDPRPVEVYNDLDSGLVNLFRVLQDGKRRRLLLGRLSWTLYSLEEFRKALDIVKNGKGNEIDQAWAFFVASQQGFSGLTANKMTKGSWSRSVGLVRREMAGNVSHWRNALARVTRHAERVARLQVDCRDGLECIRYWDTDDTLFYCDPPYVTDTRSGGSNYQHEMTSGQHRSLVKLLLDIKGGCVLSGYEHHVYNRLDLAGWHKATKNTSSSAAGRVRTGGGRLQGVGGAEDNVPRCEVLWVNPKAMEWLKRDALKKDGRLLR